MDRDFEKRLARRRALLRQRQVRRRRMLAGAVAAIGLTIAGAIFFGHFRSFVPEWGSPGRSSESVSDPDPPRSAGAKPDSTWRPWQGPVPILMYHVIGEPAGEVVYPDLYLSTDDFRSGVRWLRGHGYTAVTLSQVQDAWFDGGRLPRKPIVLSFDDGYLGQYLDAMPILRRIGWAGLLNLKAEGSDLSAQQVKKMVSAGWEVASHSITHPDLRNLSGASLTEEIAGSRQLLERELGIKIDNFCYPAGMYHDHVIAAVKAAGYRGATTVNSGLAAREMPFELNRIRIDRGDGADAIAAELAAAGA